MGVSPTHWRSYNKDTPGEERVDQILAWLAEPERSRPHLYTLYFENVDNNSHWHGPNSPQNIEAIKQVDAYIGRLMQGIAQLQHAEQVNIILLSDHGQAEYRTDPQPFILNQYADLKDTSIVEGGSYLSLYFDQKNPARAHDMVQTVNQYWKHGQAYLSSEAPLSWQVGANPRFPDVILMPELGYAVLSSEEMSRKISAGDHGWAPEAPAMHGFFVASGPNIKPGLSLGPVNSVDVYPLMLSILGLDGPETIDGDAGKLAVILSTEQN
jgi:predicted AlkP superfamily pyrophosphatase or phosphodiesterase